MSRLLSYLNVFIFSIALSACGGGGSGSNSSSSETEITPPITGDLSINGKILPEALVDIDFDTNDPESNLSQSNNGFVDAQPLSNYYTVNGFATKVATNRAGDRFANDNDDVDVYKVSLEVGQQLRLQIVDFEEISTTGSAFQGDLDLILFNSDLLEISRSESITEFESIVVPNENIGDGSYYVVILAYSGSSKYVLNIDPISDITNTNFIQPKFMMNEAIIKFKQPLPTNSETSISTTSSISSISENTLNKLPLQLSHNSFNRAMLTTFTPSAANTLSANNTGTKSDSPFLSELNALNPKSYEHFMTLNNIKDLRMRDDVEYAQPNYIRTIKRTPNDKHYSKQWHYPAINLTQAWDLTTGTPSSGSVIVAVIDTGVFLDHEDLRDQLVPGYDFISNTLNSADNDGIDSNPDDPGDGAQLGTSSWHGTHVAGTIAASTNNNIGIAGVSWGAKIMPLRVLGPQGGTDYDIGQAALFAARLTNDSETFPAQKADIINMSLGGPSSNVASHQQYMQSIFNSVRAAGVIIVAAAGNENSAQPSYPAAYEGVLSIAATDAVNDRAPYSNFANASLGSKIDLAAPGGNITLDKNNDNQPDGVLSSIVDDSSGTRKNSYSFYQGTSMAAPHVAGVLALMRAVYPGLTPQEVDTLLASGSITNDIGTTGQDNLFGYGLIDAFKAVNEASRLANGGTLPDLPPLIIASPSSLNMGANSTATLTISNSGDGEPLITSFSNNDISWLSVSEDEVDNTSGLGTYTVGIDRTGLADSSNTGKITFNINTGSEAITLDVNVSMFVGTVETGGTIGNQFVLLIDPKTGQLVDQVTPNVDIDGNYNYQFSNLASGSYQIISGSDVDNDSYLCQLGESCGGYPVLSRLSSITLVDTDISELNFVSGVLSSFGTSNTATANSTSTIARKIYETNKPASKTIIGLSK